MSNRDHSQQESIEAISGDAPVVFDWTATEIAEIDMGIHSVSDPTGDAVRQTIIDGFDGFDALAEQVGGNDELFQSTDWERASGKAEDPIADLIGN